MFVGVSFYIFYLFKKFLLHDGWHLNICRPIGVCLAISFSCADHAINTDRSMFISCRKPGLFKDDFTGLVSVLCFFYLWIQHFLKMSHNVFLLASDGRNLKVNGGKGDQEEEYGRGYGGETISCPTVTLSNVRSLRNKLDELSALLRYDEDCRHTSLFCFTETWLSQETAGIHLDGFTLIWFDRDTLKTSKTLGGGLCIAVNSPWATNITVRKTICSKDLVVSIRPYYLLREFTQITVMLSYVPGPDFIHAAESIANIFNNIVNRVGDQPVFLLGDFNRCEVTTLLPNLEQ